MHEVLFIMFCITVVFIWYEARRNRIMTKKQKAFYDYLQKLKAEEREGTRFVETAQKEFFRYWEKYEKEGVKDSMTIAMEATEAFVEYLVRVHLN